MSWACSRSRSGWIATNCSSPTSSPSRPQRLVQRATRARQLVICQRPKSLRREPFDALVLLDHALLQPRDLLIHPHQDGHDRLTALLIDRLGVRALHDP
jgi:hypothetical protein